MHVYACCKKNCDGVVFYIVELNCTTFLWKCILFNREIVDK